MAKSKFRGPFYVAKSRSKPVIYDVEGHEVCQISPNCGKAVSRALLYALNETSQTDVVVEKLSESSWRAHVRTRPEMSFVAMSRFAAVAGLCREWCLNLGCSEDLSRNKG